MYQWKFCCILICLCFSIQAQQTRRDYSTNAYNRFIQADNPTYRSERKTLEREVKRYTRFGSIERRTLPIVFHIMYTEDTTAAIHKVVSQMEALNRDFSFSRVDRFHPRYENIGGNTGIQFSLAATRNQALTGSGISTLDDYGTYSTFDRMKSDRTNGVDAWDTDKYINVWVVKMSGDLRSYAQLPLGPVSTDGIVIDYRFFGQSNSPPYHQGKTLTHLMGSYLGLIELWGESRCADDGVADTPIHNAPNRGDYTEIYTLTGGQGVPPGTIIPTIRHVSTCRDNPEEMVMNFMDASLDASLFLFTHGQIKRMQAILSENGPRASLTQQ